MRTCATRSSPISTTLFPQGVNWDAALAGLERPDVPSHESNMPNFFEAEIVIDTWEDRLWTELPMDVAAAAEELRLALDPVFAGAPAPTVPGTEPAGSDSSRHRTCRDGAGDDVGLTPRRTLGRCDGVDH